MAGSGAHPLRCSWLISNGVFRPGSTQPVTGRVPASSDRAAKRVPERARALGRGSR